MEPRYIVIELQTNTDGTIGTQVTSFADKQQAENKYHYVLSAAAVSSKPIHACTMLSAEGFTLKSDFYKHDVTEQAEPVPEGE